MTNASPLVDYTMPQIKQPRANRRRLWKRIGAGNLYINGFGETVYDGRVISPPGARYETRLWDAPAGLRGECIRIRNAAMRIIAARLPSTVANIQANVIAERIYAKRGGQGSLWEGPKMPLDASRQSTKV